MANSGASTLGNLKFADCVEPVSGFTKVDRSYTSSSAANVRSSPTTGGTVRAKLVPGQRVCVAASVTNSPWMLVSEGVLRKATSLHRSSDAL